MPGNFQSDNTAFESRWASVLGDRICKGKPLPSNRIQGVTVSGASTSQVVQPAPLLPTPANQAWENYNAWAAIAFGRVDEMWLKWVWSNSAS